MLWPGMLWLHLCSASIRGGMLVDRACSCCCQTVFCANIFVSLLSLCQKQRQQTLLSCHSCLAAESAVCAFILLRAEIWLLDTLCTCDGLVKSLSIICVHMCAGVHNWPKQRRRLLSPWAAPCFRGYCRLWSSMLASCGTRYAGLPTLLSNAACPAGGSIACWPGTSTG